MAKAPEFSAEALPHAVKERVADRFRVLGDPTRLRLVKALHADGELVERVGMFYGAVSKQLATLCSHGLLGRWREGTEILHRIADPSIEELCDALCRGLREDWAAWGAALEGDLVADESG